MIDMTSMTNAVLVDKHNDLAFAVGRDALKNWKGKKSVLIDRIDDLNAEVKDMEAHAKEDEKPRTIRSAAIELLCEVDYYEDRDKPADSDNAAVAGNYKGARSVGLPYDEIIRRIKDEFIPLRKCETTVACLRWYAVKIRVEEHGYEGLRLPQRRPRVKSKKG